MLRCVQAAPLLVVTHIWPEEVENALRRNPKVRDVGVRVDVRERDR